MKKVLFVVCIAFCFHAFSQNYAFNMNEKLGMGINLGNAYEATGLGEWGVHVESEYFSDIVKKGFTHVRIPARWSAHALEQAPYTISSYFMDTIQWAVNKALSEGLYVVLDVHHYEEMMTNPANHKDRFLSFWAQISERFEVYSDSLFFEVFNEPHDNFTPTLWNQYLLEGISVIRETNPTRMIVIGTAEYGGIAGLSKLQIPQSDTCLIVTVHYYNPFNFTHQGATWAGVTATNVSWDSTAAQINAITVDMNIIKNYSNTYNVPIYIGEFGVIQKADAASKAKWAGHLRNVFKQYGFSAAYWEYCSGFGIYDAALDCYYNSLLYALTDSLGACDCADYDTIIVKNSTFDRGLNPWVVYKNAASGANALVEHVNKEARVEILQQGSAEWHLQFVYGTFPLTHGSTYTISFDSYASSQTSFTAQISYHGGTYAVIHALPVTVTETKTTYTTSFTMLEPSFSDTRLVFECGLIDAQYVYFDNVTIVETEKGVPVTTISVSHDQGAGDGLIDVKNGTLQLYADVLPQNASNTNVVWKIQPSSSLATVSQQGLVTATGYGNGSVTIRATAFDGSTVYGTKQVNILNQSSKSETVYANCEVLLGKVPYYFAGNTIQIVEIYSILGQKLQTFEYTDTQRVQIPSAYLSDNMSIIKIVTDTHTETVRFFKKM